MGWDLSVCTLGDEVVFYWVYVMVFTLMGCKGAGDRMVDERAYVVGTPTEQAARAQDHLEHNEYKDALAQFLAINTSQLNTAESRAVRDAVVRLYQRESDYKAIIAYLAVRERMKGITAEEHAENLFDEAEAYHRISYNHWAYALGMGSPYRQSQAAFKAAELYELFLKRYPNHKHAASAQSAVQQIKEYKKYYQDQLEQHKKQRIQAEKPNRSGQADS